MKLYLLRHGEAYDSSSTGKDFDRELTDHGVEQVNQIKKRLENEASEAEFCVFCSSASRTKQTYEIIAPSLSISSISFLKEMYLADHTYMLNFLWNNEHQDDTVLLIGHNNGLSDLASYLLDQKIVLPTSGLLIIDFPELKNLSDIGLGTGVEVSKCFPE
ncbi:hypothetical protein CW751_07535 [Brumimicrobium salinarum]|uniref:Phosphohistidine phosphatase SixA n=1 Tax=Brumimicrobium salinarum TaxID=2058658 RepID=A0A2I0R372_9FLAO|nr:histidine phosphatase family protein [Brumimicrobium salinarum]PKR81009.1 hypothetical protein CW751_07535 [Brumimicrobium salinarum]